MNPLRTILVAVMLAGRLASAQDIPSLIERLKDKDGSEPAQTELLKAGAPALAPLREAAGKSDNGDFRRRATGVADRLETRQAAAGLVAAWGDRWYALFINSLKCGWVHLKAETRDGQIAFVDELFLQPTKDQSMTIKISLLCQPDEYLTPVKLSLESTGGENAGTLEAKVKEDRLIVTHSGETKAQRIKSNTVVDMALLRLVTILPRTEEYPIALLEVVKPNLKENAAVKFDKEEMIDYKGEKVKARRFIVSDGESEDRFYWTGLAGTLYRVQAGAIEAVLSDEKKAKDLDTKD
ncbi:MAG TPA: hypothetical protein VKW04_02750 [Planctomycetota bacterium]|nr:hypothetical protein [Planctomycetota bacterium]